MTLYSNGIGRLGVEQAAYGYVIAQVAAYAVVGAQTRMGDKMLAAEIEVGFSRMAPVHQATGMIMSRLRLSAEDALVRLRATAFGEGRKVVELATEIVAGRFELDADPKGPQNGTDP